jgi:tetratricopeptide (TPR) repeat protein
MEVILSFKSIAKITNNYKIILEAANLINEEYEKRGEDLPLEAFVTDDGEVMLGRRKEFDYESSLEANYKKILFVEGWPERLNTRWAEERVRNLLADNYGIQSALEKKNTESIVYWGKDVAKGVITVEFTTEQDANRAWENLEKNLLEHANIPDAKPTHSKIVVRPSKESNISAAKRYNLQIGELELVVRGLAKGEKEVVELSSEQLIAKTVKKISDKKAAAAADSKLEKKVDQLTPPVVTEREKKWWCNKSTTPSLSQCIKAMNELYCIHQTLPPPPREWLHESRFNKRYTRHGKSSKTSQKLQVHRRELLRDVVSIVGCMQNSIRKGVIRALGSNDAYALSEFLTRAMLILSESPVDHGVDVDDNHSGEPISPYNACQDALAILHSLNLDVHPNHYSHAIRSACHESLWEEAAAIFLSQIEGDDTTSDNEFSTDVHTGGFTPVDPTLGWDTPLEIGLYAVAADAFYRIRKIDDSEEVELSPSKIVFDTAMKMSMVAPSNQESYVLAAGSALGRAGLWSDCLDFCTDQSNLAKFGPSLAAAAMLSCIESSRSAEAIELYNYFFNSENQSTASEWQWAGGNLSAAKPLFDDLLLRAMGGVSGGGFSGDAIGKFCELVDNVPFSGNALLGLMHSIEYDGDWLSAIKLLEAFCDSHFRKRESKWRLVNEMLSLSGVDIEDAHAPTKAELEDLLSKMLASTMRTCNREGFFSLSLLVSSITNSFLNEGFSDELFRPDDESMIKAISAQKLLESEAVRNAYVQSLYRVGLKRIVHTMSASDDGANTPLKNTQTQTLSPTTEALLNALATTNQLLMAIDEIQHDNTPLSDEDRILFMRGISRAMNFYMDADHPASAMHIFQYANNVLAKKRNILATKGTSYLETVRTFFDDDRSESTAGHQIFANKAHDYQSLCDPLLASVIRAYAMSGHPEEALAIFEDATSQQRHESPSPDTIQSFNIALEVLLENDIDKFMSLFQNANSDFLVPSTFLAVARSYARDGAWPEIGEVYNKARRRGCVSEELGFIAMQAVCEAELLDGKITVLRKIADDISNTVGMKTEEWISSQYWYIKRYVGFHYARVSIVITSSFVVVTFSLTSLHVFSY